MTKKYYIAGPVKGRDAQIVQEQFYTVQKSLELQGHQVINPVEMIKSINLVNLSIDLPEWTDDDPVTRRKIIGMCLFELLAKATHLIMLPDWQKSQGATLERDIAMRMNIPIEYI